MSEPVPKNFSQRDKIILHQMYSRTLVELKKERRNSLRETGEFPSRLQFDIQVVTALLALLESEMNL